MPENPENDSRTSIPSSNVGDVENAAGARTSAATSGDSESDGMYSHFNVLVLISTFTTALIIAFLSLIAQVASQPHDLLYEIGMWLSLLSAGIHLWVAIVGGRAALLALPSKYKTKNRREIEEGDLIQFLVLCEQLQLLGTIIFTPSALILIPRMFDRIWFAILLYILAGCSVFFIFRAGFWKASVFISNLKACWEWLSNR